MGLASTLSEHGACLTGPTKNKVESTCIRRRTERFLEMFEAARGRTLSDCALDAGFGSYAQFYRVFTAQMGCGPRKDRGRAR